MVNWGHLIERGAAVAPHVPRLLGHAQDYGDHSQGLTEAETRAQARHHRRGKVIAIVGAGLTLLEIIHAHEATRDAQRRRTSAQEPPSES